MIYTNIIASNFFYQGIRKIRYYTCVCLEILVSYRISVSMSTFQLFSFLWTSYITWHHTIDMYSYIWCFCSNLLTHYKKVVIFTWSNSDLCTSTLVWQLYEMPKSVFVQKTSQAIKFYSSYVAILSHFHLSTLLRVFYRGLFKGVMVSCHLRLHCACI